MPSRPSRSRKPTAGERAKAASDAHKTVARNRKATHDYFSEDRYEAGLVLTGTEVKALRMGRASLTEAWIEIALARGKQDWDKRQSLREAQDRREAARAMAWANRRRN